MPNIPSLKPAQLELLRILVKVDKNVSAGHFVFSQDLDPSSAQITHTRIAYNVFTRYTTAFDVLALVNRGFLLRLREGDSFEFSVEASAYDYIDMLDQPQPQVPPSGPDSTTNQSGGTNFGINNHVQADYIAGGNVIINNYANPELRTPKQNLIVPNPIRNGDFEQGKQDWGQNFRFIRDTISHPEMPVRPRSGNWLVWFGQGMGPEEEVYQEGVVLPLQVPLYLQFYYQMRVGSDHRSNARIIVNAGSISAEMPVSRLYEERAWTLKTIDISVLAGQTIAISFFTYYLDDCYGHVFIDDVAIVTTPNE